MVENFLVESFLHKCLLVDSFSLAVDSGFGMEFGNVEYIVHCLRIAFVESCLVVVFVENIGY